MNLKYNSLLTLVCYNPWILPCKIVGDARRNIRIKPLTRKETSLGEARELYLTHKRYRFKTDIGFYVIIISLRTTLILPLWPKIVAFRPKHLE